MMEVFTGFSKMFKCSQEKVWLARNELKQAVNLFISEPRMKQHRTAGCHFLCVCRTSFDRYKNDTFLSVVALLNCLYHASTTLSYHFHIKPFRSCLLSIDQTKATDS
jgi:hypothetical protein